MNCNDRVVLITGAASGIGRALCEHLGREQAILGVIDRNAPALDLLVQELTAAGVRCSAAVADVRDRAQVQAGVEQITNALGPVDILIASAGVSTLSVVDDLDVKKLEEIVQVNFLGVVYSIDAVLPAMLKRGSGQLVGIASLAAVRGLPFESAYCASKAALAAYLESLRPALRRRGIGVTTVYPGFVRTPLLNGLLAQAGMRSLPGAVDVDEAAFQIMTAIHRGRRVCCFPRSTSWLVHGASHLPPVVYDWVMTRIAARIPLGY